MNASAEARRLMRRFKNIVLKIESDIKELEKIYDKLRDVYYSEELDPETERKLADLMYYEEDLEDIFVSFEDIFSVAKEL